MLDELLENWCRATVPRKQALVCSSGFCFLIFVFESVWSQVIWNTQLFNWGQMYFFFSRCFKKKIIQPFGFIVQLFSVKMRLNRFTSVVVSVLHVNLMCSALKNLIVISPILEFFSLFIDKSLKWLNNDSFPRFNWTFFFLAEVLWSCFKVKAEGLWLLICVIHFCYQAGGFACLWVSLKEGHSEMFLPSMGLTLRYPHCTNSEILSSLCFQASGLQSWMPPRYRLGGRRNTSKPQKSWLIQLVRTMSEPEHGICARGSVRTRSCSKQGSQTSRFPGLLVSSNRVVSL